MNHTSNWLEAKPNRAVLVAKYYNTAILVTAIIDILIKQWELICHGIKTALTLGRVHYVDNLAWDD